MSFLSQIDRTQESVKQQRLCNFFLFDGVESVLKNTFGCSRVLRIVHSFCLIGGRKSVHTHSFRCSRVLRIVCTFCLIYGVETGALTRRYVCSKDDSSQTKRSKSHDRAAHTFYCISCCLLLRQLPHPVCYQPGSSNDMTSCKIPSD